MDRSRRFAVVTSCPMPLAHARLAAAGLPVPDTLVTPELTTLGKPDPGPYLLGAELLGAAVSECILLEDAPSGVVSGRAAGMTVIAVLTTHARSDLPGADAYVAVLTQLADALGALGISLVD